MKSLWARGVRSALLAAGLFLFAVFGLVQCAEEGGERGREGGYPYGYYEGGEGGEGGEYREGGGEQGEYREGGEGQRGGEEGYEGGEEGEEGGEGRGEGRR